MTNDKIVQDDRARRPGGWRCDDHTPDGHNERLVGSAVREWERLGRRDEIVVATKFGFPAEWSWIVPPMSGALTPVYHRYYDTDRLVPEFAVDDDATRAALEGVPPRAAVHGTPSYSPMWTYLRTGQVNATHAS